MDRKKPNNTMIPAIAALVQAVSRVTSWLTPASRAPERAHFTLDRILHMPLFWKVQSQDPDIMDSVWTHLVWVLPSWLLILPVVEAVGAGDAATLYQIWLSALQAFVLAEDIYRKAKWTGVTLKDSSELDFMLATLKTIVLLGPKPRFPERWLWLRRWLHTPPCFS